MITTIKIEYFAAPNKLIRDGKPDGWLPMIAVDGRVSGHTFWPHGYDKEIALQHALAMAQEEASRYIGDQVATISERK